MATINPLAMKGSINTGLNIIGAPNNAGSEILKILGTIVAFPKAFNCCDFAFQQDKIHSPRVFPVPPKKPIPNVIKIGWKIGACPFATNAAFAVKAAVVIGAVSAIVTICPCTPQHHNNNINAHKNIEPGTELTAATGVAKTFSISVGIDIPK